MHCALISDTYMPDKNSAAELLSDLVYYSSINFDVRYDVYTVGITEPEFQLENVRIVKYRKDFKKKSNVNRAFYEILSGICFCFLNLKYFRNTKYDAVIYYNPTILQIIFVLFLKLRFPKAVFVLILRDIFPDWAIDLGLIKNKSIKLILHFIKGLNIKLADIVYCESKNKLEHVQENFPQTRADLLYNWATFNGATRVPIQRRQKRFVYAGNIGPAQNIFSCLSFLNGLTDDGHIIDFFADGNDVEQLKKVFKLNKNINFLKPVSKEKLENLLPCYDGGLVFLAQEIKFDNIPGKILSYLKHGLPIFGALNLKNELIEIARVRGLGCLVDDRAELASPDYRAKIIDLCNNSNPISVQTEASEIFGVKSVAARMVNDIKNIYIKKRDY